MKKIILAAIATLSIAQSVQASPGADMQAAILGLPAGEYTQSELTIIQEARRDDDVGTEQFYIKKLNRVPVSEETREIARQAAATALTRDDDMMISMEPSNGGMMDEMEM
ncbi:MAG: hypothetical protein V4630_10260 [Pseudomonadota bacterium]